MVAITYLEDARFCPQMLELDRTRRSTSARESVAAPIQVAVLNVGFAQSLKSLCESCKTVLQLARELFARIY